MIKKILIGFLVVLAGASLVMGLVAVKTDINQHRGQIEAALSQELGRKVKLGGDIHINLSMKGLTLAMEDVAFGNPVWASRPDMATIKLFDLRVGLLPLLARRVDIKGLSIEDADLLLESNSGGEHNWDMQNVGGRSTPTSSVKETEVFYAGEPVVINIAHVSIKNTSVALRGEDGKLTVFKTDDFTLGGELDGLAGHFTGSFNDLPITSTVTTNRDSLLSKKPRPLNVDLTFANYHVTANGRIGFGSKSADFETYEVTSADTKIGGRMIIGWANARPVMQGTILSDRLVPADLKIGGATTMTAASEATPAQTSPSMRIFSDTLLALGALKYADVNLDVAIGALPAGSIELSNIKGKLQISNGHLFFSPLTMMLGVGTINGQINLDTSSSPARLGTTIAMNDVDLTDLIKAGGIEAFLSGKVKADLNLTSSGNSMHELASNLNGPINMISAGGDVISSAKDSLSSAIAEVLSPGTGNKHEGMNCLVARFLTQNGVVKSSGILVDTAAATAAGYGDIDLRSESIDMAFHAKPKLVDVGGLLPPMHIKGTLANPSFTFDANAVVQNVGQMLAGGVVADGVPDVMTQQGQNACAYTLDHPSPVAVAASKGGVVQDMAGKAKGFLKGLFGK